MPKVIPLGTSYDDFWYLNPRKINIMVKAYNEAKKTEMKQANMLFHLEGMYFMDALLATVGNMFRGKGQKAHEYPKEPYSLDYEYEQGLDMDNEEDRDIALKRRQFVTHLNNIFRDIDTVVGDKNVSNT